MPAAAQFASKAGAVVTTPHVRAELVAQAPDGVTPGAPVWVGLRIAHQPEWHTYWKNAGDSGLPTELALTLPPGLAAGDIAWPTPQKIRVGTLANYGYEGTVLLPVPLSVAPDFRPAATLTGAAEVEIRLRASWLVCRKECIPEEGDFALRLPAQGSTALHQADFAAARATQPVALAQPGAVAVRGQTIEVAIDGLPPAVQGKALGFFPETGEVIHNAAVDGRDWTQGWQDARWTATLPLAEQRSASPETMAVVVALQGTDRTAAERAGQPIAWRAEARVAGPWPSIAPRATLSPELANVLAADSAAAAQRARAGPAASGAPSGGTPAAFLAALLGAFLGGLLLNLMPCVFPVLAIKILGFARQAGDHGGDPGSRRRAALAYTGGVLLSFLALGGAMLALRAAGAGLGWGFQLQSPAVVAALAALFTLIGLNLAGVFDVGRIAPQALVSLEARHPVANDFLSGVLAVLIASPCTAPFMGASLGYALGLPGPQALALFAALGLGMALPYLLAGFVPAVVRWLPKPGAWMETLRRLLAFPMFATVAWLVWVLGQQSGIDGAGSLLALLVCLAAVVWALTLAGRTRVVVATLLIATSAGVAWSVGRNVVQTAEPAPIASNAGAPWERWSEARAGELAAAGRPVFVDFTAAWCVTCQYNKKATLSDPAVLADFDRRQVALLRADWTRRDPAITAALAALGRNGVPVYVLQVPGRPPRVLTEILGRDELRAALAAL